MPDSSFKRILISHITSSTPLEEEDFEAIATHEGGYNHVRIYELHAGNQAGSYVVKVPSVGTAARWKPEDAYMLRSQVGTMNFIRERTWCPVPKVLAYDDTLTNDLGAPFMIMEACTGVSAEQLWFAKDADGHLDLEKADYPFPFHEAKRKSFLRDLARAMAELRTLEFDAIGVLDFDNADETGNPTIGPQWFSIDDPTPKQLETDTQVEERPVFNSSLTFFLTGMMERCSVYALEPSGRRRAMHYLLDTVYRMNPFASSKKPGDDKETFVLRHDDLNLRNIFCDPSTAKITGIIDWEASFAAPRCIGYASLPAFLIADWASDYSFVEDVHHPWVLDSYRKFYTDAMVEATGPEGDGKYTAKSALYQKGFTAVHVGYGGGNDVSNFEKKLLSSVECLARVDLKSFRDWMGDGNLVQGRKILETYLTPVVEP